MAADCIEFSGFIAEDGYGRKKYRGRSVLAHRLSYAIRHGLNVLTMGGTVLHSCDRTACINPDHLSFGTQLDNIADMVAKGRQAHPAGAANPNAVLTAEDVAHIRLVYKRGDKLLGGAALGRKFGVAGQTINNIMRGGLWNS